MKVSSTTAAITFSARPKAVAAATETRPVATGRFRVRSISRSMSRSTTWFSTAPPPDAQARPTSVATSSSMGGRPFAAHTMAPAVVTSTSSVMLGFVISQ